MRCHWLICESGDRWEHAARHFGPEMLAESDDQMLLKTFKQPTDCLAAITDVAPAIVVWQLPAFHASTVLQAIEMANAGNRPILQFAALSLDATCGPVRRNDLELALREMGVFAVLDHPLSLLPNATAIRKFWRRHRRQDNLTLVQQIWDRLPWANDLHTPGGRK
ncbi:MAG: hypothetical protein R3C05_03985 [Pirellulaceae bacterium]